VSHWLPHRPFVQEVWQLLDCLLSSAQHYYSYTSYYFTVSESWWSQHTKLYFLVNDSQYGSSS
jgi:hypothetical protein